MGSFLDYTVNGLVTGNIYALLAVGLALIFGVGNLINFAHGSVFTVGAYVGWMCTARLHLPFAETAALVAAVCGLLGWAIERLGLRPLGNTARVAPLLATIGIGFVIDQSLVLAFGPDPRAMPDPLPDWRLTIGGGTVGAPDLAIAATGVASAMGLFAFLRFTKLGWAVRAAAQDRDAARQMGVDVDAVSGAVFAIASALGGLGGLLVAVYYGRLDPGTSLQATLKGITGLVLGGAGSVPGALVGGLLLGLAESYGVALFGSSLRNLFALAVLVGVLAWRPHGLFGRRTIMPAEPLTGTFIAPNRPPLVPAWAVWGAALAAAALPLAPVTSYVLQTLTNAWLAAMLALGLTLLAGTVGVFSLGQAALLAIGAYASALLALRLAWPPALSVPAAGLVTAALGTLVVFPALRLRGHYAAVATLAIGDMVGLVILHWEGLTGGASGLAAIPPLSFAGRDLSAAAPVYWIAFGAMAALALAQRRLLRSHLGRTWRAIRDDEAAARSCGIGLDRYKALAFAFGAFGAGMSGAITAHAFSYIDPQTFDAQLSLAALAMVILGGMGNVLGAIAGAVLLVGLPELFRVAADGRILIHGLVLLALVRFRPQGLLGTA